LNKGLIIVGGVLWIVAMAYISRPEVGMKLGGVKKCQSHGKFIEGWYNVNGKAYYELQITDAPEPPRNIIEKGRYLKYIAFENAFDEACRVGKLPEEGRKNE